MLYSHPTVQLEIAHFIYKKTKKITALSEETNFHLYLEHTNWTEFSLLSAAMIYLYIFVGFLSFPIHNNYLAHF